MTFWQTYLLEINAVALLLCGIDKLCARRNAWRVPEVTLLLCAVLGGSAGLLLGMLLLWHKVQHKKFILGVPCMLLAQTALAWVLCY